MQGKLKTSMHNTNLIWKTALKFDLNFSTLADVVLDYIKTNNGDLYFIRMTKLCGQYDVFVKQVLSELIRECQELYNQFDSVERITLTESRLIILYEEFRDEIDRETKLLISESRDTPRE